MNFADKRLLSGYLVGIGKVRADGSQEYHKIPPVKNMIVKQGLNNWLRYNGSNSQKLSVANSSERNELLSYPGKHLNYCAYGTSNATSDFVNTTDLVAPAVIPYATKKQYYPYCGSTNYDNNGNFRIRCSHLSPAASSATSVRELGYYTHYTNGTNVLFSRVVLPFTYSLDAGEQLLTTYEFLVNFPYSSTIAGPTDVGLYDANGVQLKAQAKQIVQMVVNSQYEYATVGVCKPDGTFGSSGDIVELMPFCSNAPYQANYNIYYWKQNKTFPVYNSMESDIGSAYIDQDYSKPIITIEDYVVDSFKRDTTIVCPTFWPNMTSESAFTDIYYINFNNLALRFGHVVDGVFTPTPWRKYANKTTRFVYRQSVATAESIAWQQNNF